MLALLQVEGEGLLPCHSLHAGESRGVVKGHMLRALVRNHAVHIHIHIGGEIRTGALTIVRAQVVPAVLVNGEIPGDHVARFVKGGAVQEVHLAVVVGIGGQTGIEFARAANGGLIARRNLLRLNDDQRFTGGVALLHFRHNNRCLQRHSRQIHAAILNGKANHMAAGSQLKEHGLSSAVSGIADARLQHAFRLPRSGGDLVAVAVHREHAVIHPDGIQLHALHFCTQYLTVNGDGHLRGQGGRRGIDIAQPDLVLAVFRCNDLHLTRLA